MKASDAMQILAPILQEMVDDIENSPELTKNRCDQYLSLLSRIQEDEGRKTAILMAGALTYTTANKEGVLAACKILQLV